MRVDLGRRCVDVDDFQIGIGVPVARRVLDHVEPDADHEVRVLDPERHVEYTAHSVEGVRFPGICVGEPDRHVVWGLTYRFLEVFFEITGRPLPDRWRELGIGG